MIRFARATRPALVSVAAVCLFVVIAIGVRISLEVVALGGSPANNAQWTIAQLEADYLLLSMAAGEAERGGDLDPFRLRYDLFYSRIAEVENGRLFAKLRSDPEAHDALTQLRAFIGESVPLVDGPDPVLRSGLEELRPKLGELHEPIRSLSHKNARAFAADADAHAALVQNLLLAEALTSGALVTLVAFALFILVRQHGHLRSQTVAALRGRERFESMVDASLDAVVVVNAKGVVTEFSRSAEVVFGLSRDCAVGRQMATALIPERHRTAFARGMRRHVEAGDGPGVDGRLELKALRADGAEFPAEISVGAASDADGPILISYIRDISDRRAAERALTEARDRAMLADKAKSEFIAVMSHEMRTPLSGVLGVLDLLNATELSPRQLHFVDVAIKSGEILLRHVNDVLDLARIEAGKLEPQSTTLDIADLARQVADLSGPAASAGGNRLELVLGRPQKALSGDPHLIRQMLLNLVGNSIKFTRNGKIVIETRILTEDRDGAELEFSVSDTGVGMDEADLERIFDDFVMVDAGYERENSGSGLGLAICRRIASALGGTIGVESKPGQGSRFWIRLRLVHTSEDDAPLKQLPAPTAAGSRRLRVLLVEDNGTNRLVAREMLEAAGHEVVEAPGGMEGVAAAGSGRFDVILMDISMPGMDGIAAARRIRSGNGLSKTTPIIALTAHARPDDLERFLAAGMQDCIVKPVRMRSLGNALQRMSEHASGPSAPDVAFDLFDADTVNELSEVLPEDLLAKTLLGVCAEIRDALPRLASAGAARDLETLASAAHRLAGSAGMVGASALREMLALVETRCKAGDGDAALAAAASLGETAEATCVTLQDLARTSRTSA